MKNIKEIILFLLVIFFAVSTIGCSEKKKSVATLETTTEQTTTRETTTIEETTTEQTTSQETTTTIQTTLEVYPFYYYIPPPKKLYNRLKPIFKKYGYDFDTWKVSVDVDSLFLLSEENGYVLINYDRGLFKIQLPDQVRECINCEDVSFTLAFDDSNVDTYEILDAILEDCPNECKISGDYLKENRTSVEKMEEVADSVDVYTQTNGLKRTIIIKNGNQYCFEDGVSGFAVSVSY